MSAELETKHINYTLRNIPPDLYRKLQERKTTRGSINAQILFAIQEMLENDKTLRFTALAGENNTEMPYSKVS